MKVDLDSIEVSCNIINKYVILFLCVWITYLSPGHTDPVLDLCNTRRRHCIVRFKMF